MANEDQNESIPSYLRYPINELSPDMPGRPVQDPALSWEMAHTEKPYRDLALAARDMGEPKAEERRLLKDAAYKANRAEEAYYESFGTTKTLAKRARETNDLTWVIAESREQKQERLEQQSSLLDDMRRYNVAFGVESRRADGWFEKIPGITTIRDDQRTDIEMSQVRADAIFKIVQPQDLSQSRNNNTSHRFNYLFQSKLALTTRAFTNGTLARQKMDPDGLESHLANYRLIESVLHDTNKLVTALDGYIQSGTISAVLAQNIFASYDLCRRNPSALSDIIDEIAQDPSALESVLNRPIPPEPALVARKLEYETDGSELKQAQIERAIVRKAEDRLRLRKRVNEQNRDFIQSQEYLGLMSQRTQQIDHLQRVSPELFASVDGLDLENGGSIELSKLDDVNSFVSAVSLRLARDSDPIEQGFVAPILDFDIWNLWRNDFKKPDKYYGGRPGNVAVSIHPLTEAELEAAIKKVPDIGTYPIALGVSISVSSIKGTLLNEQVDFTSVLDSVIYMGEQRLNHETTKLMYQTLDSTFEADMQMLALQRGLDIKIGRAVYAASTLRTLQGGSGK